jgi:tetratricopeptide (TPR) repeat protein
MFLLTSPNRIVIVLLVCGWLRAIGSTQTALADADLVAALRLLEEGRTTLEDQPLSAARAALTRLAQQHPENAMYFYQLARVNRYRVEAYAAHGGQKDAERALDEAIANVQQSLKLNEKSADAHSLLADLYGRKISFGIAMFAGPKYGPKVDAENRRAFELDPNNSVAFASRGRQYLESPKMFGGDLDKAIADFRKATQLDPKSDETFVWLALALRKKGDNARADQAVSEALRLNPRNTFAKQTAKK